MATPFQIIPILIQKLPEFNSGGIAAFTGLFRQTEVAPDDVVNQTAELSGSDLYLGLSDGTLAHFTLDPLLLDAHVWCC